MNKKLTSGGPKLTPPGAPPAGPPQPDNMIKAVCTKCETIHNKKDGVESVVDVKGKAYVIQVCGKCRDEISEKTMAASKVILEKYFSFLGGDTDTDGK